MSDQFNQIFKKGSKTFYNSTFFFPTDIRQKITRLYAFVRRADDYVDSIPQQADKFFEFKELLAKFRLDLANTQNQDTFWKQIKTEDEQIVASFVDLENSEKFDTAWADSFLQSMEMDLTKNTYQNLDETKLYIYGSASVIGLFVAKILDLPISSYLAAEKLGSSFQYINFIRDIGEDLELGRNYFPQDLMAQFGLKDLNHDTTKTNSQNFIDFTKAVTEQYKLWQKEGESGFQYIPKKYLIAIKTASDMYLWTAKQIEKDPFVVYRKKVKPSKLRILFFGIRNFITL